MSTDTRAGFDVARAEVFASRFLEALNDGALCLITSHQALTAGLGSELDERISKLLLQSL